MSSSRSRQGGTLVVMIAVAFGALLVASATSALAADVSAGFGAATFEDATPTEVNTLTVTQDVSGNILFTDSTTPPTDIGGCPVLANTATCPPATSISVILGGGDDTATIDGSVTAGVEVSGGPGGDTITGAEGDDLLSGDAGADIINGNGGADVLSGDVGVDTLNGGAGDDRLDGGSAAGDMLLGGEGNDTLSDGDQEAGQAGPGQPSTVDADALNGGPGQDAVDYGGRTQNIMIDLSTPDTDPGNSGAPGENDDVDAIEDITSGAGDDTLTGSAASNSLSSGFGADTVAGGGGDDTINAGPGNDPSVTGGEGDDSVDGDAGNDTVSGGNANDTVSGGAGNDISSGDAGDDVVNAVEGVDIVNGGTGDDVLTQDDQEAAGSFVGSLDGDTFNGGDGNDTVSYTTRRFGVTVTANDNLANDGRTGGSENDNVQSTVENIEGGSAADVLTGTADANELLGGEGADVLSGLGGSDGLFGGIGNDTLSGGVGRDELRGERGDDTVQSQDSEVDQVGCGAGTDTVTNDAVDRVEGDCESVAVPPIGGPAGPAGPQGLAGRPGAPGPTGPQGPPGALPKITVKCKLTGKKKKKIKCTVKIKAAQAQTTVRMRLSRSGRVIAKGHSRVRHGKTTVVALRLRKPARAGRYTLKTVIPTSGKAITISQRFVIR